MECPKCGFVQFENSGECSRCGIVFAKFLSAPQDAVFPLTGLDSANVRADVERVHAEQDALKDELRARVVALPCALLGAWAALKAAPGLVRIFTMWVHETGHAVAAWLCGYSAWPGPWVTPIAAERSFLLTAIVIGLLGFGGYQAWQRARWFWVVAAALVLIVSLGCNVFLNAGQARQLIVFGGDGGSLVLGTVLMLTVYARADHPLREERLRWALLIFGALSLMDAYLVWSGPFDRLPFGQLEHGLSDPSVLAEEFGWGVLALVHRYNVLARTCFVVLAAAYVAGIAESARALRRYQSAD